MDVTLPLRHAQIERGRIRVLVNLDIKEMESHVMVCVKNTGTIHAIKTN